MQNLNFYVSYNSKMAYLITLGEGIGTDFAFLYSFCGKKEDISLATDGSKSNPTREENAYKAAERGWRIGSLEKSWRIPSLIRKIDPFLS